MPPISKKSVPMKYLVIPIILLLASCASISSSTQDVELTGRLLGWYVGTSSGMNKGHILHISDPSSLEKVSAIGKGNPQKVLLVHSKPDSLDGFAGKEVKVTGKIHAEQKEIFHTDFVLSIIKITEQ